MQMAYMQCTSGADFHEFYGE